MVRSVEKALRILELFSERRPTLTVADIVESNGMHRVTAYRFCRTLEALGYLEACGERSYRPGLKTLLIGHAAVQSQDVRQLALPYLERLKKKTGETANMAMRYGDEIVYLIRLRTNQFVNIHLYEGSRLPVHSTSMGKAILAFLPEDELEGLLRAMSFKKFTDKTVGSAEELRRQLTEVRRQGYALNEGELANGLKGAAAPILNRSNYPIAAVNVAVTHPITRSKLRKLAAEVLRTANAISDTYVLVIDRGGGSV